MKNCLTIRAKKFRDWYVNIVVFICSGMTCPHCRSAVRIKNGKIKGTQRYKCKDCGCNYTVPLCAERHSKHVPNAFVFIWRALGFGAFPV